MCTRMKMCEVRSERAVRRKMCVQQVSVYSSLETLLVGEVSQKGILRGLLV